MDPDAIEIGFDDEFGTGNTGCPWGVHDGVSGRGAHASGHTKYRGLGVTGSFIFKHPILGVIDIIF